MPPARLRPVERHIVNLVTLVQTLQCFERANLTAACGGMQKIRVRPIGSSCAARPLPQCCRLAPAGQEQIAPDLQIEQPPDAIGGVLATGAMPMDERFHLAQVQYAASNPSRERSAA